MKKLTLFLVFSLSIKLAAQTCYIQKSDASGVDIDQYQSALNDEACLLRDAFPTDFQSGFKVFGFGYYLHLTAVGEEEGIFVQGAHSAALVWSELIRHAALWNTPTRPGRFLCQRESAFP